MPSFDKYLIRPEEVEESGDFSSFKTKLEDFLSPELKDKYDPVLMEKSFSMEPNCCNPVIYTCPECTQTTTVSAEEYDENAEYFCSCTGTEGVFSLKPKKSDTE